MDMRNGLSFNNMQYMRLQEHPIQIKDNLIVSDNLEEGELLLYEQTGGPLNIQQLIYGHEEGCKNAVMIAGITINDTWQEDVFIQKIFCEYGYEHLAVPMIYQVVNFAKFYESCKSVTISENERETWFLYAGGILSDFHKKDNEYVYQIR